MTDVTGAERLSEEMALPTPNLPLLRKVLDHIDAHPDEWSQIEWYQSSACGTTYCIAGHALAMSGELATDYRGRMRPTDGQDWPGAARDVLGLTLDESGDGCSSSGGLFSVANSRSDVQRIAEQIAARAGEVL